MTVPEADTPPPAIRDVMPADAPAIAAIYAPYVAETAISFEEIVPDPGEMADRIARISATHPYLVAEQNGSVIAYAYGAPYRDRTAYRFCAEVTVYADRSRTWPGVGRMLYSALLLRLAEAGMHTALGVITLPNPASVRLHEAMGFRRVAVLHEVGFKFGRWHDTGTWQRGLADLSDLAGVLARPHRKPGDRRTIPRI